MLSNRFNNTHTQTVSTNRICVSCSRMGESRITHIGVPRLSDTYFRVRESFACWLSAHLQSTRGRLLGFKASAAVDATVARKPPTPLLLPTPDASSISAFMRADCASASASLSFKISTASPYTHTHHRTRKPTCIRTLTMRWCEIRRISIRKCLGITYIVASTKLKGLVLHIVLKTIPPQG
jgi:hypothetical protein